MYFFLHIPRTAGTTLNSILAQNFQPEEILSIYHEEDYRRHSEHSAEELRHIRLIQGHLLLQQYDPPLMYGVPVQVFTFLRDPVERLVSEYAFQRAWPANHLYAYLHANRIGFREYIESREKPLLYRGKNFMTRSISGMDSEGRNYPVKALSRAKRNLEKTFGFTGIQERFMESLLLLGEFMGLKNLLHERRNVMSDAARPKITQEDRGVAEEYNRADRELYTFARDLFDSRVQERGGDFRDRLRTLTFLNEKFQKVSSLLESGAPVEKGPVLRPKDGQWK